MERIDINCMLGQWPFRKIRNNSFECLKKVHIGNRIGSGYISYLNSIFYNDPFEGEIELQEIIKGSNYKQIMTINPELPGYAEDITKGLDLFDIKGVRIYPGYHDYDFSNNYEIDKLCNVLLSQNLPLFITMRMEDERLDYLLKQRPVLLDDLGRFLKGHRDNKIVLLNIRPHEILKIGDLINSFNNIYVDTSGMKDLLFVIEELSGKINYNKIFYGSNYPLYCHRSTVLLVEKAKISTKLKDGIFYNNINAFYGK